MRRRAASDDAVEVEMVEVGDLTGVDGAGPALVPDADAQDSDRHARRRRVLRWVGGGVLAALATGAVVVNVQAAREAAARQAALADLPWVLPHLDGPLEEVWRAPGGWVVAETTEVLVTYPNTGEGACAPSTHAPVRRCASGRARSRTPAATWSSTTPAGRTTRWASCLRSPTC